MIALKLAGGLTVKIIFILLVFSIYIYADTIAKTWQISEENSIVSVEDEAVHYDSTLSEEQTDTLETASVLHAVSDQQDINALPLAKTIPMRQTDNTDKDADLLQTRVDAIKKIIEAEKSNEKEKTSELAKKVVDKSVLRKTIETGLEKSGKSIEFVPSVSDTKYFWGLPSQQRTYLIAGAVLLLLLIPLLFRRKGDVFKQTALMPAVTQSQRQMLPALFIRLQGEVRQQFLTRKQNIIFNSDFTQYQKAKALLDLEKEYIDLEYNYLPKLFCDDYEEYTEAQEVLFARSELREVIQDFIEGTLKERAFTRFQQEQILRKIRTNYRTTHYNWQVDDIVGSKQNNDEDEHAYLLQ